jgi:hypothetical protein
MDKEQADRLALTINTAARANLVRVADATAEWCLGCTASRNYKLLRCTSITLCCFYVAHAADFANGCDTRIRFEPPFGREFCQLARPCEHPDGA